MTDVNCYSGLINAFTLHRGEMQIRCCGSMAVKNTLAGETIRKGVRLLLFKTLSDLQRPLKEQNMPVRRGEGGFGRK